MTKKIIAGAILLSPLMTFAAAGDTVTSVIGRLQGTVGVILPFILSLAVLFFFWGLAKFIMSSGEDKEKGKDIMIWGIIALFVMVSVWGIVALLSDTLGVSGTTAPDIGGFIPGTTATTP
jgi:hypothetical protein